MINAPTLEFSFCPVDPGIKLIWLLLLRQSNVVGYDASSMLSCHGIEMSQDVFSDLESEGGLRSYGNKILY